MMVLSAFCSLTGSAVLLFLFVEHVESEATKFISLLLSRIVGESFSNHTKSRNRVDKQKI